MNAPFTEFDMDAISTAAIGSLICSLVCAAICVLIWRKFLDSIARLQTQQASEAQHGLKLRDLSPVHEKINRVAEDLAATRAQATTQAQMLGEQLRLLQRLAQDSLTSQRRRTE
jgi:hypothetical protein